MVLIDGAKGAVRRGESYNYLFVYDSRTRTFPKRFWVAEHAGAAAPPDINELDGRVMEAGWEAVHKELKKQFSQERYAVNRMSATSWSFVENNFHGLHFHDG